MKLINSFGLAYSDPDSSSCSELSVDGDWCDWSSEAEGDDASGSSRCGLGGENAVTIPSSEQLLCALQANNLNWLSFVDETKMMYRQLMEGVSIRCYRVYRNS